MRDGKVKAIEIASADMQFGGEESNQRQTRPLAQPKRTKKLVASTLERGLNTIDSGDRQWLPRSDAAKVSCSESRRQRVASQQATVGLKN
jgi:hypothetical protein